MYAAVREAPEPQAAIGKSVGKSVEKSVVQSGCFHCGQALPSGARWSMTIDGVERAMCCPGCEAVARTIIDSGCGDYYRTRTAFSPTAGQANPVPEELRLYDTPEAAAQFATAQQADGIETCEAVLSVEGIRCAACVWLIEHRLASVPGVRHASLNVASERLLVRWEANACRPSDILHALRDIGYTAYPYDAERHAGQLRRAGRALGRRLFIAGLSMMQVMMYAVPAYLADDGTMEADMASLMRWASLLLTLPAVCYSAQPFFRGAWMDIRRLMPGMDVPVALGVGAAFIASAWATWTGRGAVYFDSVTMFIFLLLCSRYVELLARRRAASAMEKLQHALPASALRIAGYPGCRDAETVAAAGLREGDFILVRPGDAVAADCVIVEGGTAIDLSLLTGESEPQRKTVGDFLAGGAVNASQAVVARVLKPSGESTLSALIRLVERAGQAKPRLALWADRVAAWSVAALLLFTLAVFIGWQWLDPERAWQVAIAVLVVSCPCALSLATPTALAAATDRLLREGILVVKPHVLETLHRTTHVVFDKTGTLTLGRPVVRTVQTWPGADRAACLRIAAALEASSMHPLARAISAAAGAIESASSVAHFTAAHFAGKGMEGFVDGRRYRLGSAAFAGGIAGTDPGNVPLGTTPVFLATEGAWLARFDLADALRSDARDVVARFRESGKTVILLSGDRQEVAQAVADEAGIPIARGECLPEEKLAFVQELQRRGAVVAMVGDGINDAAVLRAADVSFAMGSGAALAQAHADTVLLSGRLGSVWEAADAAARTMAVIRQNLAWATAYNLVAIPAAAMGWLNPWLSGIGMSLSSAVVVANALRLRRIRRSTAQMDGIAAGAALQPAQ